MIALCTGKPMAEVGEAHIMLTVPSGKQSVQLALSLNQLLALHASIKMVINEAFDTLANPAATAELLPFRRAKEA